MFFAAPRRTSFTAFPHHRAKEKDRFPFAIEQSLCGYCCSCSIQDASEFSQWFQIQEELAQAPLDVLSFVCRSREILEGLRGNLQFCEQKCIQNGAFRGSW